MPGQTPETLEAELLAEMERLKTEPVTDEELTRAKNQIEAAFVFQEDSVHRRASLLARFELIGGYALKDRFLEKIRAVTAADLLRVAPTWFDADRKNVGHPLADVADARSVESRVGSPRARHACVGPAEAICGRCSA